MSAPQAAAITACTACAAVGGAAAGGAFSSGETSLVNESEGVNSASNEGTEATNNVPPKPISWYSIKEANSVTDYNEDEKIGKAYSNYLVGAFSIQTDKDNRPWWDKSFEKYSLDKAQTTPEKRSFSTEFTDLDKSFVQTKDETNTTDKALNKACHIAYKKSLDDIKVTNPSGDTDKKKLRDDLWRYCSDIGEVPVTVKDAKEDTHYNTTNNKLGKTKADSLLATKGETNAKLWKLKNEEFKLLSTEPESEYFKKVHQKIKAASPETTLKAECEKTYSLTNSTDTESYENTPKVKEANVIKYCSLNGK